MCCLVGGNRIDGNCNGRIRIKDKSGRIDEGEYGNEKTMMLWVKYWLCGDVLNPCFFLGTTYT